MNMEPKDRKGSGDGSAPKGKRAPTARKRTPKSAKTTDQNGATATEREVAPQAQIEPARTQSEVSERSATETRTGAASGADQGTADLDGGDPRNFGDRDADLAADVAADIKSWMDTRREDRDAPREVL
jgi:hypothetical protein